MEIKRPYEDSFEHKIGYFIYVYPPHPTTPSGRTDGNGNPCETYYVLDTKKSWKNNDGWMRGIKRLDDRRKLNMKKLDAFDQEVVNLINQTYPLPTT